MQAPGWYHAEGDPPGTVRAWNGSGWTSERRVPSDGPLGVLATTTTIFLGVLVAINLARAALRFEESGWYWDLRNGAASERSQSLQSRIQFVGTVHIAAWSATGLVFLIWFRRAYINLRSIRGSSERASATAVLWWLAPMANLWVPFTMMRELVPSSGSDPNIRQVSARLLWAWWLFWVGAELSSLVRSYWTTRTIDAAILWSYVDIASAVASAVAAMFAMVIVNRVSVYQDSRIEPSPIRPTV